MTTIGQALDYYYGKHGCGLRSADAAKAAIDHIRPALGSRRLMAIRKCDYLNWATDFQASGHSLGYASRILSVVRASLNRCEQDGKIARAPRVPEIRGKEEMKAEPERGRPMTTAEIAILFDNTAELHLLTFLVAEINSAARPEATLEAHTGRIDWERRLIDLNPAGRRQTKKHRPILKIAETWDPWLRAAPSGYLVTYDGKAVKSVKKAMQALAVRSKLAGRINATSIRHSLARYMENKVPDRQISIFLGHEPVARKRSTRRYSPINAYDPDYLRDATAAVEAFVREVDSHSRKWDLLQPFAVRPTWKSLR